MGHASAPRYSWKEHSALLHRGWWTWILSKDHQAQRLTHIQCVGVLLNFEMLSLSLPTSALLKRNIFLGFFLGGFIFRSSSVTTRSWSLIPSHMMVLLTRSGFVVCTWSRMLLFLVGSLTHWLREWWFIISSNAWFNTVLYRWLLCMWYLFSLSHKSQLMWGRLKSPVIKLMGKQLLEVTLLTAL